MHAPSSCELTELHASASSSPPSGGFLQSALYDVPTLGFVRETFDALVDGVVEVRERLLPTWPILLPCDTLRCDVRTTIPRMNRIIRELTAGDWALVPGGAQSILRAHASVQPGGVLMNTGQLVGASVNRSPTAYLNNPEEERAQYAHDVDTTMVQASLAPPRCRVLLRPAAWIESTRTPESGDEANCVYSSCIRVLTATATSLSPCPSFMALNTSQATQIHTQTRIVQVLTPPFSYTGRPKASIYTVVDSSKWSCLAAAGGAPRVGQPGWACGHTPASPVLPLEGAGRSGVRQPESRV